MRAFFLDGGCQLALLYRNLGTVVVHSPRALLDALPAGLACFFTGGRRPGADAGAIDDGRCTGLAALIRPGRSLTAGNNRRCKCMVQKKSA